MRKNARQNTGDYAVCKAAELDELDELGELDAVLELAE
jgi:hypothetical protein